jgi:hypothetical protein
VADRLTPAERQVFEAMPVVDQREGLRTARRFEALRPIGGDDSAFEAAALLHDAGKQVAGLGVASRVAAALVAIAVPGARIEEWRDGRGSWRRRLSLHLGHAEVGRELLAGAGARPAVAAWAGAHHTPGAWAGLGLPGGVAESLARADGERR